MQKGLTFITGSQFHGSYNNAIHCMEGYGKYMYPDGSQYRGNFKKGKFHGIGEITLTKPFNFKFVGEFEAGKLIELHEMTYHDGLHLNAKFNGKKLNFDEWKYCTEEDRRTSWEIINGLGPSGQHTIMTNLEPGTYDVGGGIYKENTGWVVRIPPPFFSVKFLSCNKEREWIQRNCRKGPWDRDVNYPPVEPIPEIGKQIINANIKELHILHSCACDSRYEHKTRAEKMSDCDESAPTDFPTSKSSSLSSFCDELIKVDLREMCYNEERTLKYASPDRRSKIYFSLPNEFFSSPPNDFTNA
ncbi:MORN repeat-containing protein 5-like [Bactrocera tryoni]|uniref:MORN repeat-containing protein 5-like n=1 Tax=Bactrocera tryoni TaxID=59916 RepID=UPI001A95E26B|nr:MORN repeat-containing protein 5-like [Bactrocera tryoni]